jgi:hypothetical protein
MAANQGSQQHVAVNQNRHLQTAILVDELAAYGLVRRERKIVAGMAVQPGPELVDPLLRGHVGWDREGLPFEQDIPHERIDGDCASARYACTTCGGKFNVSVICAPSFFRVTLLEPALCQAKTGGGGRARVGSQTTPHRNGGQGLP